MLLSPPHFSATTIALATAFVLGGAVGIERQIRQRTAGLRTNVLVAVGAAAFVDLGARVAGPDGSVRVISYVVSGIGFLGAGVIMKEGAEIRGLNTAATLWASAAIGAFAGAGQSWEAVLVTGFVLAGNTLLRPIVDVINRRPMRAGETEALYQIHVTCQPQYVNAARDILFEELEKRRYPIRDISTLAETEDTIQLTAVILPSTADFAELDLIVSDIQSHPHVDTATWTVSALS